MNIFLNLADWSTVSSIIPLSIVLFGMIVFICGYVKHRKDSWPQKYKFRWWGSLTGLVVGLLPATELCLLVIEDEGTIPFELGYLVLHKIISFGIFAGIDCDIIMLFLIVIMPFAGVFLAGLCASTFFNNVEYSEESVNGLQQKA